MDNQNFSYLQDKIIIKGARENNLKNIDVEIPKFKLVVFTGISGSGKTSLVQNILYQEGKRIYLESLNFYDRKFFQFAKKPNINCISGLAPVINIEKKKIVNNSKDTVGTITEIYHYLQLIYAHIGVYYDIQNNQPYQKYNIEQIMNKLLNFFNNKKIIILSPLHDNQKKIFHSIILKLIKEGFNRFLINNNFFTFNNIKEIDYLEINEINNIFIIIDHLTINHQIKTRLISSLELAIKFNKQKILIMLPNQQIISFDLDYNDGKNSLTQLENKMNLFSFYKKRGICNHCKGLGSIMIFDEKLILDQNKSILDGAILPFEQQNNPTENIQDKLKVFLDTYKIDVNLPLNQMNKFIINILLYGPDKLPNESLKFPIGIIPILEYYQTNFANYDNIQNWLNQFKSLTVCPDCSGARLNKYALSYQINNKNIYELTNLTVNELLNFLENITLNSIAKINTQDALTAIKKRLNLLKKLGLEYLNLNRNISSLSGGEIQRIKLINQLASRLTGVIYIIDEPSVGLHPYNNIQLIKILRQLVNLGNTVLIIEHDQEIILSADYIIDLGPEAGNKGGNIVSYGKINNILEDKNSLTGKYLKKIYSFENIIKPKISSTNVIQIRNACVNNLKNINIDIPLNIFVVITGFSGSGKSTLLNEVIYKGLKKIKNSTNITPGFNQVIFSENQNNFKDIIHIESPNFNKIIKYHLINYLGISEIVSNLFSQSPEARAKGYNKRRFILNSVSAFCHACQGEGVKKIFMGFLPNIIITCDQCQGKRFNSETLTIRYKNQTIANIYDMNISEAYIFFHNHKKIKIVLELLISVGLNYLKLGNKLDNLSDGEKQRLILIKKIYKNYFSKNIYILDEPTKGLHFFEIEKLMSLIRTLINQQNTVIMIEHNINIIKNADYIIDLGPQGGKNGGYIVAKGDIEEIINNPDSYTGQYLKKIRDKSHNEI
ncbi:MAG: excinuclease ABC subunit UvrA [Sweet potato little leaf phytoplasma]|uniref:excinuclease ABC subunit UvrA n=1 Tax=Candidatus Phytoplasma australasiaticum TaxID=2754999 RepID=UPI0027138B0B|nr:excinuclease ABC subunit UvrA [Sweet potato little leaf phytoplasma]MDO8008801.1 excinuclease ABC subunit UvrA [Sweet potato little leaf phytoplasma]MDO8020396.1 excinuclease ABC subunit UvrA [Sweet potato little leaf phytoplasma]MDV3139899.1 excinuclease ABC subunit UvrA [Sweet potato little leaf phytoplasma]MDV3140795.1 excinuclease ABC subunit UvrA [Sweet potato little leaf phytoplasma]MDV3143060.1 excinuclease ABC subunit UvrA [Sweet potato little leaf phytoplasma]